MKKIVLIEKLNFTIVAFLFIWITGCSSMPQKTQALILIPNDSINCQTWMDFKITLSNKEIYDWQNIEPKILINGLEWKTENDTAYVKIPTGCPPGSQSIMKRNIDVKISVPLKNGKDSTFTASKDVFIMAQ